MSTRAHQVQEFLEPDLLDRKFSIDRSVVKITFYNLRAIRKTF